LALQEAGERVIQARERANIERGRDKPSLSADGSASRSFAPSNTASSKRLYTTSYGAELNASWQIDLFGKIRRAVESSDASFKASVYDRHALTHALIADLLNRRIAVAINKNLLELAQKNAQNRADISKLVKRRYNLGVRKTALADVYLAEENATNVLADTHQFERLLADQVYRLDVLLGQVPGTTQPERTDFPLLAEPLDVPLCLPADLLDRRPDLKASELRLKAANADIGVAVSDLYPSLSLGASIGFCCIKTNNLFRADRLAGSILSRLTTRLFEGGRIRANIRLQESELRALVAAYSQDILDAMREVETALKSEQELDLELENTQQSVDALRKAEQLSQERYIRGILTLKEYLDIQQRRYVAEQGMLNIQQLKWNARIALYMALGGDWLQDEANVEAKLMNNCETEVVL
jgi:NodT family efflux transporter outer membrane factor (OMF) lipoprotein